MNSRTVSKIKDCANGFLIDLVIFPYHDWKKCEKGGFRDRDLHLIQHIEKNKSVGKILIIDRPTTLPEMVVKKTSWRVKRGQIIRRTPLMSITKVSEKIYVLDIFSLDLIRPLILKRDWWDCIFRKENILRKIQQAIHHLGLTNIVLFLWTPFSNAVIGHLSETLTIFDAMDNFCKHPEIQDKRGYIKRGYEMIKREADIVFVVSKAMKAFLDGGKTHPILIPNGVDKTFFELAKDQRIPNDLKNIRKPRVGYIGRVSKRLDVELVIFLVKHLPRISFIFIGEALNRKWVSKLFRCRNVHFLGVKHYRQLPGYLANFDVCIIPHNVGALETNGDLMKTYEYLAAGKPVVTTNIAGVGVFKDVITIAETKEEFLKGVIYWLQEIKRDEKLAVKLRNSLPESCSWGYKADIMIKIIVDKLYEQKTT